MPGLAMAGACAGRSIEDGAAAAAAQETGRAAASAPRVTPSVSDGTAPSVPWPAGMRSSHKAHGSAFVCFCEDVRGRELTDELGGEATDPEILKRRTAVLTGPCQGKYCLHSYAATINSSVEPGPGWALPTGRPPLRPVRLSELVRDGSHDVDR